MNCERLKRNAPKAARVTVFLWGLLAASAVTSQTTSAVHSGIPARNEEIAKLLVIVRDPDLKTTHPEKVAIAIQQLGQMRAVEAIPDLIELLTFRRKFEWERDDMIVEIQPITTGNRYPATGALFEIGRPALPALARVVELHGVSSLLGQNALYAIDSIFRDDPADGIKYLQRAAEASREPASAQRLSDAAAQLKQLADQRSAAKK